MTSEQKIKADRANAKASTGPKTLQGKARAAQNARRHGLSLSVLADPVFSAEAKNLGREIVGEGASPEILELANRFAEAQIDFVRIRHARYGLLARKLNEPNYVPVPPTSPEMGEAVNFKPEGLNKLVSDLSDHLVELIAMDRYERRALSRRKFAVRALDATRRLSGRRYERNDLRPGRGSPK